MNFKKLGTLGTSLFFNVPNFFTLKMVSIT
jgi:hypothetical protein